MIMVGMRQSMPIVKSIFVECVRAYVFNDHDEKRQLDAKGFGRVGGTRYVVGGHVGPTHFED